MQIMKIILLIFSIFRVLFSNFTLGQYLKKVPGEVYSCYTFDSLIGDIQMKQYYVTDILTKLVNVPKAIMTTKIQIPRKNGKKLLKLISKYTYPLNE